MKDVIGLKDIIEMKESKILKDSQHTGDCCSSAKSLTGDFCESLKKMLKETTDKDIKFVDVKDNDA